MFSPEGDRLPAQVLGARGAVVVFWATWCSHCLADLPSLSRLSPRAAACGLPLVGVSVDTISRGDLARWLQRHAVGWAQVFDGRGYNGPIVRRYRVTAVPHAILVDRTGRPLTAALDGEALTAAVERACSAPP